MILIREAVEEDAEPLAKLATELGYKTTKDDVAKRFNKLKIKVGHRIYVAVEKKVVGFISFEHYETIYCDSGINITGFVVEEEQRNKGIGRTLMEEVEKYAIANKFAFIRANSGSKRIEAHEVYRRLGFDSEKEQKRFLKKIDKDVEI